MSNEPRSDPSAPILLVENIGAVRLLTLNRPDKMNAFDAQLYLRCAAAFDEAAADDSVKVLVVTGAGRAFSAGADRTPGAQENEGAPREPFDRFVSVLSFPKPLIGAVNGVGVGIGSTMLGHFDIVLIDPAARLRAPFTMLGVAPEAGSSYLFTAVMGQQRASKFLLTSEWMSADEAVACGLAVAVSQPGQVVAEALALAAKIAEFPLASLSATKRSLLAARAQFVQKARDDEMEVWQGLSLAPMPGRGSASA